MDGRVRVRNKEGAGAVHQRGQEAQGILKPGGTGIMTSARLWVQTLREGPRAESGLGCRLPAVSCPRRVVHAPPLARSHGPAPATTVSTAHSPCASLLAPPGHRRSLERSLVTRKRILPSNCGSAAAPASGERR